MPQDCVVSDEISKPFPDRNAAQSEGMLILSFDSPRPVPFKSVEHSVDRCADQREACLFFVLLAKW